MSIRDLVPWKRHTEEEGGNLSAERPRDAFAQMRREMDSLYERFFNGWPGLAEGQWSGQSWGFDVDDKENEIVVRAEAPGFKADDFNVDVVGDSLVLKAEHKEEEKQGDGYQFSRGQLYRRISLPRGVDADKIEASYRNGVLEVHVPKGEEAKGTRITIKEN